MFDFFDFFVEKKKMVAAGFFSFASFQRKKACFFPSAPPCRSLFFPRHPSLLSLPFFSFSPLKKMLRLPFLFLMYPPFNKWHLSFPHWPSLEPIKILSFLNVTTFWGKCFMPTFLLSRFFPYFLYFLVKIFPLYQHKRFRIRESKEFVHHCHVSRLHWLKK